MPPVRMKKKTFRKQENVSYRGSSEVYQLFLLDGPFDISTEDIERTGRLYHLLNIIQDSNINDLVQYGRSFRFDSMAAASFFLAGKQKSVPTTVI